MSLKFNSLFTQRDVRETPASTATASAVGLTAPEYVTLATDTDLVNERVLTAGEGIDLTDGGAGSTITISGENASTTNKGIASFEASDFDTSSGHVTIDESGVNHDALGNYDSDEHIDWTQDQGATNIHSGNYSAGGSGVVETISEGEGINVTGDGVDVTIAAELATTANKGVASFNSSDFTVSSGAVSLKNKTSYLAISSNGFHNYAPTADTSVYQAGYSMINVNSDNQVYFADVQLPHGAVVTACIVYGSGDMSDAPWTLQRFTNTDGDNVVAMATANTNTADTSITSATINNEDYFYRIYVTNADDGDYIYGARITYTTDYI